MTVTETVTTEAAAPSANEGDPAAFCETTYGDELQQADSKSGEAFNTADVAMMIKAEKRIYAAAKKAPPGAECAVTALESLRFSWNNGSQNFSGVDTEAKAKAVRKFQEKYGLRNADIVY